MSVQQNLIAGVCVAIGIASVGISLKAGIDHFVDRDRVVTVKGLAERNVQADYVIWPVTFRVTGNDLSALYEKAQTQSEEIRNFLISQGIKAQDISQGTPSVQDLHADFYGNNLPPERYRMEMAVSVATTDVDTVLKAMVNQSELIQKGVLFTQNYRTQFSFNGLNSIKPEMVEEATKNARSTAQKFAEDSDSELGKIRRASQGQFSIYDRDSNTPYIKRVRVVTTVEYYLKD
ncbi:SIMPL domain-containing protein [Parasutterella secunda]|uniref:SIMPL domain-containing protein n=1 Tax=Parasutterella secunda TaxID=626947 RepID=UPI002011BE2C|nr:SIMPL domain-containing protein [Parasutterella secunda]MCL1597312.1 SIMPL domain-containing protein [Parasutterella secunda]MCR8920089.1 SIMPL domain-containing protein [Parasutterella secunda]MDM8087721.1 SIMPL domain-containing protein [Parasutterella secunda]MDM8218803.1 SIMPL domain-containing protein [Parasutterella secunda]MDM8226170.1 SIMPL domain-containing protein [Parasutterella secunda]